jgi:hypothetical protein
MKETKRNFVFKMTNLEGLLIEYVTTKNKSINTCSNNPLGKNVRTLYFVVDTEFPWKRRT